MNLSIRSSASLYKEPHTNSQNFHNTNLIKSKAFNRHSMIFGYSVIISFIVISIIVTYVSTHPSYLHESTTNISEQIENRTSEVLNLAYQDSKITKTDFKNDGWLVLTITDVVKNPQQEAQKYAAIVKKLRVSDIMGVKVVNTDNATLGIAF